MKKNQLITTISERHLSGHTKLKEPEPDNDDLDEPGYPDIQKNPDKVKSDKEILLSRIHSRMDYDREMKEGEIKALIGEILSEYSKEKYLSLISREQLGKELYYSIRKLDILQEMLEDEDITEIMINGPDKIFIEKKGELFESDRHFSSREKLEDVIQQITARCNRVVNEASPIVDCRLEDGSRVNVVLYPIALNGPIVTIRRFPKDPINMEKLIAIGSLPREAANWLKTLVLAGYNIIISGGTGSGKTTFLNALSGYIPKEDRIITIEDSAELQLLDAPNLVRMETRNANAEGSREISIRDLIKSSLRMRPTRLIVGEVRGGEALDLLQCLNTGHDGSLSTGHANSARDMLSRLESMVLMAMDLPLPAIRRQIASGVDIIVQLGRLRDRSRRVLEVAEVMGMENGEIILQTLCEFVETSGREERRVRGSLVYRNELTHREKLRGAGLPDLQPF